MGFSCLGNFRVHLLVLNDQQLQSVAWVEVAQKYDAHEESIKNRLKVNR